MQLLIIMKEAGLSGLHVNLRGTNAQWGHIWSQIYYDHYICLWLHKSSTKIQILYQIWKYLKIWKQNKKSLSPELFLVPKVEILVIRSNVLYILVWPQWWSFADVSQQGLDFSKTISKRKIIFWFDFHRCSHGSSKSA